MALYKSIELPVKSEPYTTGNILPLLHEIRHALQHLIDSGKDTIIDLRSLPMAPGEEAQIEKTLGRGEVNATLNAQGITIIQETSISGVWWVIHHNENEEVISKFIEIARIPSILNAQTTDMLAGISMINQLVQVGD